MTLQKSGLVFVVAFARTVLMIADHMPQKLFLSRITEIFAANCSPKLRKLLVHLRHGACSCTNSCGDTDV